MQVSEPNDVKVYNLSAGRSLPEWLSERKRRALLKKNIDIKHRLELIQDFNMPAVSQSISVSSNGKYIMATGIYKPRIKCYDVNNLSLKFERCFDSEAVTFQILSEDYSKIVLLQCDRYVEFHAAYGRLLRLRVPKYGRDLIYNKTNCDLYIGGCTSDIYRLNLERGQFLTPFTTEASEINRLALHPHYNLLFAGTAEGKVETWDPRVKQRVGVLDVAVACVNSNSELTRCPAVTVVKCEDNINLAVGTSTGQVLLYDMRCRTPFTVKDHMNGIPIRDVNFHYQQDLIFSLDSNSLKIWNKDHGKLYTSIESTQHSGDFNHLCLYPQSGLFFLTCESPKIQSYFVPSIGPAPKWAAFLDSLTEEMEEIPMETLYDDYKFVSKLELEELQLDHLIGSNLVRAYMHGYFIDIRLYKKVRALSDPFEFDAYKQLKIRKKIEEDRVQRSQVVDNLLPKVNQELYQKVAETERIPKNKKSISTLISDNRFTALFDNPDFEIDKNSEEYRLLNPVLSKKKIKHNNYSDMQQRTMTIGEFQPFNDDDHSEVVEAAEDQEDDFVDGSSSSDDDREWAEQVKKEYRKIRKERKDAEAEEEAVQEKLPKMFELKPGQEFSGIRNIKAKTNNFKLPLGERLAKEDVSVKYLSTGNREMTFSLQKKKKLMNISEKMKKHRQERVKIARKATGLKSKSSSKKKM